MVYGQELIERLENEIERMKAAMDRRDERINRWETDEDDCFISERVESRTVSVNRRKIDLIKNGGTAWFQEYATTDGRIVNAHWCNTKYGDQLRVVMPDKSVVWTTGGERSLKNKGLKKVLCLRPAWFAYKTPYSGMMGVYAGDYELFPSDWNYATGEQANDDPIEIKDI